MMMMMMMMMKMMMMNFYLVVVCNNVQRKFLHLRMSFAQLVQHESWTGSMHYYIKKIMFHHIVLRLYI